jgi:DNA-binding response OmpR family regulator
MNAPVAQPRVLLIDSNVYFSKRLNDALKKEGFEVLASSQAAYALTMIEWNAPAAILCATNLREMNAYQIAPILRADPKTAAIPLIAVGDGGEQALMEAFRSGCDDYVDRRRGPDDIAAHVRNFLLSRQEGFQPTQMVPSSMTTLTGDLSRLDLPGVVQMLNQARQTGALNINAGDTDGVIYFDGGEVIHAECGVYFGDEAVIHILKSCEGAGKGIYKFVYGTLAAHRTVLRSSTDLMLDAMREIDESARDEAEAANAPAEDDSTQSGLETEPEPGSEPEAEHAELSPEPADKQEHAENPDEAAPDTAKQEMS